MTQTAVLPNYLRQPESTGDRVYGKLIYSAEDDSWIVDAEPCVVELAKRLFPGTKSLGPGKARFKSNRRTNGDLNWFMLRYPLEVQNADIWDKAYQETVQFTLKREEIYRKPQKADPLHFRGELTNFQREGLAFLLHNRRTLLADEMGLGKTVEALAFLSTTESYPALIVVQPHLITNWKREIARFLDPPVQVGQPLRLFEEDKFNDVIHVIQGRKPYDLPVASVYIIHYHLLSWWGEILRNIGFKALIFDEIQDLRHAGTKKYSAASFLAEDTPNVIGLSGTPIYNHGGEIWNVMNILEYHCLGDWDSFTREWCTGYGSDIIEQPELLGDYLKREGLLLRRTKSEVQSELPPKRRFVQTIDFDANVYDDLIQFAVEQAKSLDFINNTFEKGRAKREIINSTRQATGIAKAPYVAQFVRMLLEAGERVLLFAYHHAVFDIFGEELKDFCPGRITGRDTAKEKDLSIQRFMNGEMNLLMISLRAAAGLNLQRANVVVFGELDWAPAIHSQAEDRAHRMGQNDSVLCYYLVSETGSDEDMQESLGLKVSQFIGLMGDKEETEEDRLLAQNAVKDHMDHIVERLRTYQSPRLKKTV